MLQVHKKYNIYIEENSDNMNGAHLLHGAFDTYRDAVAECELIVDRSINELLDYYTTPDELYRLYTLFGEEPWIYPEDEGKHFSALEYAHRKIDLLYTAKPFLD